MKELVQFLYNKNHITALTADKLKMQMSSLCHLASKELQQQVKDYSRSKDRMDEFYYTIIGQNPEFSCVRLILLCRTAMQVWNLDSRCMLTCWWTTYKKSHLLHKERV